MTKNSPPEYGFNLEDMAFHLGFTYCFNLTNTFGSDIGDGQWDGIIEEVRTGRADIGMQKLTITPERSKGQIRARPIINY